MQPSLWLYLLLCLFAGSVPPNTKIEESEIRFQIVNAGLTVNGTFTGTEAAIQFNPEHPEQALIQASVPVNTIKTGLTLRDKHLQKPDYFDAEKNPMITLQSKTIRKISPNTYEGIFELTMKGIHRDVKLPFSVSPKNEFIGNLKVNRLDFDLGKPSLILADEVMINIRVKMAEGS
ncbi:YceI family protein [Spirosoma sp. HMF4905]|uniref:YceI family protein n=1 Tax=Spirosoma arboris TaxID=2682092 RepID=A0A7K1SK69_9BACT|nr:YceI family protein [Spirosoma arboris]MVM34144.1 YceI family protein [Spirosoma arboris]